MLDMCRMMQSAVPTPVVAAGEDAVAVREVA